jgi:tetratricopeptide (TPR) repeat protein
MKSLLLVVLAGCLVSCAGLEVRSEAQLAFEQGVALFNQGRYEEAIPHLLKATELDPEFAQGYLYLGRAYVNLGRWGEAVMPLRTALRLSSDTTRKEIVPLLIDALFGVASAALQQGDFSTSITALRDILELAPRSQKALNQLVTALLEWGGQLLSQGQVIQAIDAYRQALHVAPDSSQATGQLVAALLTYGGQLLTQGQISQAINTYTEVTQVAPQSFPGYLGLARALLRHGDIAPALDAAAQALSLSPTNREALALWRQLRQR